ncbi:hypothetical protein [Paenibacillus sp. FSL R7-0026]|uniref:hypothetical protein n=1 Tax=Paenibacillus sp. FSL R7-0026 TaxID=2921668 RepID=UPI0030FB9C9D
MKESPIESMLQYSKHEAIRWLEKKIEFYNSGNLSNKNWPELEFDQMRRDWGVDLLLLRWLQGSVISRDPRHRSELERLLEDYNTQYPEANLQLDSLLSHGVVRVVWDSFSVSRSIISNRKIPDVTTSHLTNFLEQISKVQYSSQSTINLFNPESSLNAHRSYYSQTPELTWFLEQEVLIPHQEGYAVNPSSGLIRYFDDFLLSRMWEEKIVGPIDFNERLNWWIRYVNLIGFSTDLLKSFSQIGREDLVQASINRILQEEDLIGWEKERNIWVSQRIDDYSDPSWCQYVDQIPLPDGEIDKLFWYESTDEAAIHIHHPRQTLIMLFNWIVKSESFEEFRSDRPKMRELLTHLENRPFLYHMLSHIDPVAIPVILTDPDLASIGMVLLAKWESHDGRYKYLGSEKETRQPALSIWSNAIPYFSLSIRMLHQQPDQVARILEKVLTWFEIEIRRKRNAEAKQKLNAKYEILKDSLQRKFLNRDTWTWDTAIFTHWTDILLAKTEKLDVSLAHPSIPQLLWIGQLSMLCDLAENVDKIMSRLIEYYKEAYQTCRDEWTWSTKVDRTLRAKGWLYVLKWAAAQTDNGNPEHLIKLLNPFSVSSLATQQPHNDELKWNRSVSTAISVHLNLLTEWVRTAKKVLDDRGTKEVNKAFVETLVEVIKPHHGVLFNPFSHSLGDNVVYFSQPADVVISVGEALNFLPDSLRESTLSKLIEAGSNMGLLAKLYNHLERERDKYPVMKAIRKLKDETRKEEYPWINQIQVEVTELLNTRNPELAEIAQKELDQIYIIKKRRPILEDDWVLREQLRIYLVKREYEKIQNYDPYKEDSEPRRDLIKFYQALSFLDSDPPTTGTAIKILRGLLNKNPLNVSYMVNLYYACVLATILAYENDTESYPRMIEEADEVLREFRSLPKTLAESYFSYVQTIRLMFYRTVQDSSRFWEIYYSLPEQDKYSFPIGIYAVEMKMEEKSWEDALLVLEELREWHGLFEQYDQLKEGIKSQGPVEMLATPRVELMSMFNQWQYIGQAFRNLSHLSPEDQVNAMKLGSDVRLTEFILENTLDVCREVQKYSPIITPSEEKQAEEDRYTDLFVLLFNQRMRSLNWKAVSQSRGGYTGKPMGDRGGIGERDIVIQNGNQQELMIIEALNLSTADRKSINRHSQKIFGYDINRSYSYLIIVWGFSSNADQLWNSYREIIRSQTDEPFSLIETGEAKEYYPQLNFNGVRAFYSIHNTDFEEVRANVVHLYVDIKSEKLREISRIARK